MQQPSSKPLNRNERASSRAPKHVQRASPSPPVLWQALGDQGVWFVGETTDLGALAEIPYDATAMTPTLLFESLGDDVGLYHLWVAIENVLDQQKNVSRPADELILQVLEEYLVETGTAVIESTDARLHFTFVGPHNATDTALMVTQAKQLLSRFEAKGIDRKQLVLSVPGSINGLLAAKKLEAEHGRPEAYETLSADAAVLDTVHSITEHLRETQSMTQLLIHGLPTFDDARRISGATGLMLSDTPARALRALRTPREREVDKATASLRRPSVTLASASAEDSAVWKVFHDHVLSKTLLRGVGRARADMREASRRVGEALRRKLYVRTLDLQELARQYEGDWRTEKRSLRQLARNPDSEKTKLLLESLQQRKEHVGYRVLCSCWLGEQARTEESSI